MAGANQYPLRYSLLGPVSVYAGGTALPISSARHRAVLALLLLSANRDVHRDVLIDRVWNGASPDGAVKTLQSYVSRLRSLLDTDAVIVAAQGGRAYRLASTPDALDVGRFERLAVDGRSALERGDPAAAAHAYEQAFALYQDHPLADLTGVYRFADEAARRYEEMRADAMEGALTAAAELGGLADRVGDVRAAVERHPDRATLRELELRALYQAGRQADALAAYQTYHRQRRDLGLDPEPAIERLHQQVLRQDPELVPTSTPGFIGREVPLRRLRAALSAAVAGLGRCVLLLGEAGIGKTTLATQLLEAAVAEGITIATGSPHDTTGPPAFRPWRQILEIVPGAGPGLAPLAGGGTSGAREGQFAQVMDVLRTAASVNPLLILLDDVHAADAASVKLLQYACRALFGARVLLVVVARDPADEQPGPVEQPAEWGATAERLRRLPGVETIRLTPLGTSDVARIVDYQLGYAAPADLVTAVTERAGGNPLFAVELSRLLADELALERLREHGRLPAVPPVVRDTVLRRAAVLPAPSRQVLVFAAILGLEFDLAVLRAGCGPDASAAMRAAMDRHLVEEIPGRAGTARFTHPILHEVLAADVPVDERRSLHARAAEAIMRAATEPGPHGRPDPPGGRLDAAAERLSHHWRQVGGPEGRQHAYTWTLRAGRQAAAALAWEDAARLLSVAAELRDPDPDGDAELWTELGWVLYRAGQGEAAGRWLRQAVTTARSADPVVQASLAIAETSSYLTSSFSRDECVDLMHRALDLVDDDDAVLRSRVLGALAGALVWHSAGHTPANRTSREAYSRDAVQLARATDDRQALIRALASRINAIWGPGNAAERMELATEMLVVGRAGTDRDLAIQAHRARFVAALELGLAELARDAVAAFGAAAADQREADHLLWAATLQATIAMMGGQFASAEASIARSAAIAMAVESTAEREQLHTGVTAQALFFFRETGRLPASLSLSTSTLEASMVATASQLTQITAVWRLGLAAHLLEAGRREHAHEVYGNVVPELESVGEGAQWLCTMALAADLCAEFADVGTAHWLRDRLRPYAGRSVIVTFGFANLGPVEHFLGRLATVLGDWADADARFQAALTIARKTDASPLVARIRVEHGRMLLRTGSTASTTRGRELLAAGSASADRLGMTPLRQTAQTALAAPPGLCEGLGRSGPA